MERAVALERGREALGRQAWSVAFTLLSLADGEGALQPVDLEGLSVAARLLGKERECAELLARAHHGFQGEGNAPRAARCAVWLALGAIGNGEQAPASGWLGRARRLLGSHDRDCVERGYVLLLSGILAVRAGDAATAHADFVMAAEFGERFGEVDLIALALQGQGRALIRQGELARGVALLDEAMVSVSAGEVSATIVGGVYCSVLDACGEIFDLRRAREWTASLERWCASQPDALPIRGHCLVHRAELLLLHGDWRDALEEARRACERLSDPRPRPAVGAALYLVAELHRLRGEGAEAEAAYLRASEWERAPRPGLALLRLHQGRLEAARAAIRRVADEVHEPGSRCRVLDACVEIALAADDAPAARAAAEELASLADRLGAPYLRALSSRATGAVRLAGGEPREALASLRVALSTWRELEAPYEAARARVLLALAHREEDDVEAAEQELAAARSAFEALGAAPDLARVDALRRRRSGGPLTRREEQVLALVASGRTNRAIARELAISEKTVARHLSNIFAKLALSSRAAATAYAYQHDLV